MYRKLRLNNANSRLLVIILTLTLGCFSAAVWPGGTLVKDLGFTPTSIDPGFGTTSGDTNLLCDLFEGLYTYDRQGELVLGQAKSHTVSEDGLLHTFVLREDVYWSDGEPVTAQDFVSGIHRILSNSQGGLPKPTYLLEYLVGVREVLQGQATLSEVGVVALSEKTLSFELRSVVAFFRELLSKNAFFPVPTHVIKSVNEDWTESGNFVSNGAYSVSEYSIKNASYFLEKNLHYREAADVYYDKVKAVAISPMQKLESQLATGKVDVLSNYAGDKTAAWFHDELGATLSTSVYRTTVYLQLNWGAIPLGEKSIRSAIALVVPREEIYRRTQDPEMTGVAYTFAVPSMGAGWKAERPDWATESRQSKLKRARELMQGAGLGPDMRLKLRYLHEDTPGGRLIANAIKAAVASIWVDLELVDLDTAAFYDGFVNKDFDIVQISYGAYFDDPMSFYPILASHSTGSVSGWNIREYDEKVGELLNAARGVDRITLINEIESIIHEYVISIPLLHSREAIVLRDGIALAMIGRSDSVQSRHIMPAKAE